MRGQYPTPIRYHEFTTHGLSQLSTSKTDIGKSQLPPLVVSTPHSAGRLFHWKVKPIGLHFSPATFQRALDSVIGPDMEPHAFAYLDDIIDINNLSVK